MATITVLDADGAEVAVELPNADGRQAAAASRPVALATEDLAAVNAITTALADNATGADIATVVTALGNPLAVTGTFWQATQPISAASLPLPTGAATQTTLAAIETALGGTLIVDGSGVTQPVSGTIGVSGSVAVTGTFWQATQPVSLASVPALVAGSAIIGKVGIDQTTDGTTNKVNIDASLKSGTATRTTVNSGTASATILASNANRKGATIFNSDANALLLDLSGGTAAATRCQVRLTQYQSYEVGSGYTGAITGIWEADGAGQADVVEFT